MERFQKFRRQFDWFFCVLLLLLIAIGLTNLYSATRSASRDSFTQQFFTQQIGWFVLGIGAFILAALIDFRFLQKQSLWIYIILAILLLLVLFKGKSSHGARRWLEIGNTPIQPSEFIKIGIILVCAKLFSGDSFDLEFRPLPYALAWHAIWIIPAALIMRQPDLGTALICILIASSMLLLVRFRPTIKIGVFAIDLAVGCLIFFFGLRDYQRARFMSFWSPEQDVTGTGWHAYQALVAIGSGQFWGKGYMQSTQNQFRFLPEAWTDFPFVVLAEEWGWVGCVVLLALYLALLLWILNLANEAKDRFSRNVVLGCASLIFWHVLFNISMVTGLAPVVGVTLPFISYGGSSLLTMLIALGLCMNVSIRRYSHL